MNDNIAEPIWIEVPEIPMTAYPQLRATMRVAYQMAMRKVGSGQLASAEINDEEGEAACLKVTGMRDTRPFYIQPMKAFEEDVEDLGEHFILVVERDPQEDPTWEPEPYTVGIEDVSDTKADLRRLLDFVIAANEESPHIYVAGPNGKSE